jgi:hypothetical protein
MMTDHTTDNNPAQGCDGVENKENHGVRSSFFTKWFLAGLKWY